MRKLTLTIAICCGLLSVQSMAESVILNPYQILNVQSGQLYKAQILVEIHRRDHALNCTSTMRS